MEVTPFLVNARPSHSGPILRGRFGRVRVPPHFGKFKSCDLRIGGKRYMDDLKRGEADPAGRPHL